MSSKQQFRDMIKRDKELIRSLTTRNETLRREVIRLRNLLYTRKTQSEIKDKKRWWQFWKQE